MARSGESGEVGRVGDLLLGKGRGAALRALRGIRKLLVVRAERELVVERGPDRRCELTRESLHGLAFLPRCRREQTRCGGTYYRSAGSRHSPCQPPGVARACFAILSDVPHRQRPGSSISVVPTITRPVRLAHGNRPRSAARTGAGHGHRASCAEGASLRVVQLGVTRARPSGPNVITQPSCCRRSTPASEWFLAPRDHPPAATPRASSSS